MKKILILSIAASVLLSACSKNISDTNEPDAAVTVAPTIKTDKTPGEITVKETPNLNKENPTEQKKEQVENTIFRPGGAQDISNKFAEAIPLFARNLSFDMSAMNLQESKAKETILNAYNNVMAQHPELKYAYSVASEYDSNKMIFKCSIKYMPYKVGGVDINNLPAGTYKINNLKDLINAAKNAGDKKKIPIAISNPALDVDTMKKALMQTGYGYIVYGLNSDATEIIAMPTGGRTMEQCINYIHEINSLADEIISKIISNGMTNDEKVLAIYQYISKNVSYDMRYYRDKNNMPYESTTAYGALKDNTAICGGFSWAFNVLLSKVDIECYNVDGKSNGEYHMWNIASYNGSFYYFDCTYDRGRNDKFLYFAKTKEEFSKNRSWDSKVIGTLVKR